jgi:hypothetical protein
MFSLEPRCQGTVWIAEVDGHVGGEAEFTVAGHFPALDPGQGASQLSWQLVQGSDQGEPSRCSYGCQADIGRSGLLTFCLMRAL